MVLRLSGGGAPDHDAIMGFAAGGRISQKIIRDPLPVTAYDHTKAERLHVTVINAAYFQAITGLPSPPSPISSKTYIDHKLPWYELYEEHLPTAPFSSSSPLANVKSVAQLLRGGTKHQAECVYCKYSMSSLLLKPCGHGVCDDCSNTTVCPSCHEKIETRERFAATMRMPGAEDHDGVEAGSSDQSIILLRHSKGSRVVSLDLPENAVSKLSGYVRGR